MTNNDKRRGTQESKQTNQNLIVSPAGGGSMREKAEICNIHLRNAVEIFASIFVHFILFIKEENGMLEWTGFWFARGPQILSNCYFSAPIISSL